MGNAIDIMLVVDFKKKKPLQVLQEIFVDYKGYFSKFTEVGISTSEDYGSNVWKYKFDVGDRNFMKIDERTIPKNFQFYFILKNQGDFKLVFDKGEFVISFGVQEAYFDKDMFKEFLYLIKKILRVVKGKYLFMGANIWYSEDLTYLRPEMIGADAKHKVYTALIKGIKASINKDVAEEFIKSQLKKHGLTIKKINKEFYLLNLMESKLVAKCSYLPEMGSLFFRDIENAINKEKN